MRRAPPRRRGGQHLEKNKLEKKEKITKTPLLVNRARRRNKEKITKKGKITGRPKPKAPSMWRQQFVVYSSSIARFSLRIRLVPCYPLVDQVEVRLYRTFVYTSSIPGIIPLTLEPQSRVGDKVLGI